MLDSIFGNIPVFEKSMHGLTSRQRAISENMANADTPGYKRMEVAYEGALRQALQQGKADGEELDLRTNSNRHFSLGPGGNLDGVEATIRQVVDETYRNDGNNVDVEQQMATLADTNMRYAAMATLARNKFDGLKSMLREIR